MRKSILIGILFAFITSIPYLYGYLIRPQDSYFLARSVVNSADTYTHVANIISAKQGNIIVPNLYSFEDKTPFIFRPTYFILGLISRYFGVEPILSLHLGRAIGAVVFVLVLFRFLEFYFRDEKKRIIAGLIVLVSSGLGGILYKNFPSSIDLWVPEANTFFMMLESPHFVFSQIFLLMNILYLHKSIFISSIFASLLMIEHPYMVPFVLVFNTVLLISKKRLGEWLKFMVLPVISLGIIYKLYFLTPAARLTLNQTFLPTPGIENVLYGFGILIPTVLLGIYKENLSKKENFLLVVWIAITAILIYSPFSTQRRFLEGVHIPIAIFAAIGIFHLRTWLVIFLIGVLPMTNIFNINKMIQAYSGKNPEQYIHYLDNNDLAAMRWLEVNSSKNEVILAGFYYSNLLPGFTGRFVYNGHIYLSYNSENKIIRLNEFMRSDDENERRRFLQKNGINYIFIGSRDLPNVNLEGFSKYFFLKVVYQKDKTVIFKVI